MTAAKRTLQMIVAILGLLCLCGVLLSGCDSQEGSLNKAITQSTASMQTEASSSEDVDGAESSSLAHDEEAEAKAQAEADARAKAQAKQALEDAELKPTTKTLEYSNKSVDATKLVTCDNGDIDVAANNKIDLSSVGAVKVKYTLTLDGQENTRTVKFSVKDTKPPKIKLAKKAPIIDAGAGYDPAKNVKSAKDPVDGALTFVSFAPDANSSGNTYDEGWYTIEGNVDTETAGVYPITVKASDIHGNTATKTFDVKVIAPEPPAAEAHMQSYVLNTNTMKFHHPGCRATRAMKDANRQDVEATRDEVISWGYVPCQICWP